MLHITSAALKTARLATSQGLQPNSGVAPSVTSTMTSPVQSPGPPGSLHPVPTPTTAAVQHARYRCTVDLCLRELSRCSGGAARLRLQRASSLVRVAGYRLHTSQVRPCCPASEVSWAQRVRLEERVQKLTGRRRHCGVRLSRCRGCTNRTTKRRIL